MRARQIATAAVVLGAGLACPAGAGALTFARTDYPLPSLTAPVRTSDVGPSAYDDSPVALVDLNKDSKLDIVIADYGTGRVDVLLNQGGGTFAAAAGSPFPACSSDLEAHDIVGGQLNPQTDQNPDVAVICDTDGSITRLLGDGSGSLGTPQAHGFGVGSGGIGTPLRIGHVSGASGGDYLYGNGQAYMCILAITDFATAGAERCDYPDGSLPGSGAASSSGLTPVHWYDGPCFGGDEIVSFSRASYGAFLGSDLDPRIGPGGPGATSCTVPFQSSGDRNSGVAASNIGTAIRAGDLNRDGEPDVVIGDTGGNFHVTAWQGASADFAGGIPPTAQPSNFASAGPISSLGIGDLNGDGCPDIAAADVLPSSLQFTVAVHVGHCNATQFDSAQTFDVAGDNNTHSGAPKMAMGDLNGDGKPDLVTTGAYAGFATVLLNTTTTGSSTQPPPTTRILTVANAGPGAGSVTSSPAGINCGATCSASYDDGAGVALAAAAAPGSRFSGWSGDCSGTASCLLTMNQARSVTATFTPATPHISSLRVTPVKFRTSGARHKKGAAPRGATIRFTDDIAATTTLTVFKRLPGIKKSGKCVARPRHVTGHPAKCTREVSASSFTHGDTAGTNTVAFTGRLNGKALSPGSYRLVTVPNNRGVKGPRASATFTVVR
jgi:hypothetical protein